MTNEIAPTIERCSTPVSAGTGEIVETSAWGKPKRIPALDGLRGIAILLVLVRHLFPEQVSHPGVFARMSAAAWLSWSGVDLFFVLSGFLIGGILIDARSSPSYFKTFYTRRAFRIIPIYSVVTAIFLIFNSWVEPTSSSIPWFAYVTLTQNFWMARDSSFGAMGMAVTWSLAIEEQFYLTIPLLVRKLQLKYLVAALTVIVAAALLLRVFLNFWVTNGGFASYVLMPCRADSLCLGVLSAVAVRNEKIWHILRAHRLGLNSATFILFFGLAYMTYKAWPTYAHPMSTFGYSWLALLYTGILLVAVTQSSTFVHRILCNSVLMRLGTIAYCTYLIHRPLIWAGRHFLFLRFPHSPTVVMVLGGILGLAATLSLASLSWKYFEKPLLERGHKYQYE